MKQYIITHYYLYNPQEKNFVIETKDTKKELLSKLNCLEDLSYEVYTEFTKEEELIIKEKERTDESIFFQKDFFTNKKISDILEKFNITIVGKVTTRLPKIDLYLNWERGNFEYSKSLTENQRNEIKKWIKDYYLS